MTREKAIEFGEFWLEMNIDGKDSLTYQFFEMSVEALKQDSILDKIRIEIINTLYIDSLIFGELINFKNGKISADDVIDKFNRVTKLEILKIFNKYMTKNETNEFDNLDSMLEYLWNAGIEDRQYGFIKK